MMYLPVNTPLTIIQGAKFIAAWIWSPGGVPMDFTGCKARMQARADHDSPTVLLQLTTEDGGIILGREPGLVELVIGATRTAYGAIDWEFGVYDVEIEHPDGPDDVTRLVQGTITVSREVTHD